MTVRNDSNLPFVAAGRHVSYYIYLDSARDGEKNANEISIRSSDHKILSLIIIVMWFVCWTVSLPFDYLSMETASQMDFALSRVAFISLIRCVTCHPFSTPLEWKIKSKLAPSLNANLFTSIFHFLRFRLCRFFVNVACSSRYTNLIFFLFSSFEEKQMSRWNFISTLEHIEDETSRKSSPWKAKNKYVGGGSVMVLMLIPKGFIVSSDIWLSISSTAWLSITTALESSALCLYVAIILKLPLAIYFSMKRTLRNLLKRSCLFTAGGGTPSSINIVPHVHSKQYHVNLSISLIYLLTVSLFLFDFASMSSNHSHCFSDSCDTDRALTTAPFSLAPFCKFNLASSLFECEP